MNKAPNLLLNAVLSGRNSVVIRKEPSSGTAALWGLL